MKKRNFGCLIRAVMAASLLTAWITGAALASSDGVDITLLRVEDNTVACTIVTNEVRENVWMILATYNGDQMCQQYSEALDLNVGEHTVTHTFTQEFESSKAFLLDENTYTPLSGNAGPEDVRFLDYDGMVLRKQTVYTGQAALPPAAPNRDGYVFAGWDGDFESIFDHCDITASYVAQDAKNLFTIAGADAASGEEITVRVALGGTVQLCGYDMNLFYDDDVLEFVGLDSELSMDVLANHIADEGRIKFNFGALKNRTKEGDILDVTFRVKECDSCGTVLRLDANSVICVDPEDVGRFLDVEYTACEGVIRIL